MASVPWRRYTLVSLGLLLTGCATIITQGNLPPMEELPKIPGPKRTITVRALNIQERWRAGSPNGAKELSFTKDLKLQGELEHVLTDSGNFSKVEVSAADPEGAPPEAGKVEDLEKHLGAARSETDLFLDAYTYSKAPKSDAYEILPFLAWSVVYAGSLGLIPIWVPRDFEVMAVLRDSSGKVLSRFEMDGSASQWTWSPLYLSSRYKKSTDPTLLDGLRENTVRTLVKQVSESKALTPDLYQR